MAHFAESFVWCVAQVTFFTLVAACVYGVAYRLRARGNATLLVVSLAVVGLLTALSFSPWPRWGVPLSEWSPHTLTRDHDPSPKQNVGKAPIDRSEREWTANTAADEMAVLVQDLSGDAGAFSMSNEEAILQADPLSETAPFSQWRLPFMAAAGILITIGLLRCFVGLAYLWHYCRSSITVEDQFLNALLSQLAGECGLSRAVSLRESRLLGVAATAGWRRPLILLPTSWRNWSMEERRAVLAHEMAHIKQQHFPVWILTQLPLVAHYYHPLVHWLARRLRFEQEMAADQLAAQLFGQRSRYATVLAGLSLSPFPRGPIVSLGLFMSRPFLMRRIAMLRQTTEPSRHVSRAVRFFAMLSLGTAAVAVAGMRMPPLVEAQQAPPSVGESNADSTDPAADTEPETTPVFVPSTEAPNGSRFVFAKPPNDPAADGEDSSPAAIALLLVSRQPTHITGQNGTTQSDQAWQVFSKTQLALIKAHWVLQAALRDPQIAKLKILQSATDPVRLLHERVDVGFYNGSAVMYVRMRCSPNETADAAKLVDAVVNAYISEVVNDHRQQRLAMRDLLAKSVQKLNDELSRKTQEFYDISRESGRGGSGGGEVIRQLDIKRLDRIETELMRLENDQLELETSGRSGNPKFFAARIADLTKRQEQLEEKIVARSEKSVDLTFRQRELDQLQRIADDMSSKLELMDIEANAPEQIQVIQPAVVTGGGEATIK